MKYFKYPIGILLFNRPHLTKFVLRSLKESNIPLKEELLIFHLDGYEGSKCQAQSEKDRTAQVEKLVRKYFPKSHVIKQHENIGIAKSFYTIMDYIFQKFDSDIALFQEEDVFLHPHYFEVMEIVIRETRGIDWVGALSINDIDHYQNKADEFAIPTYGTREMALKRQVFCEGKEIFNAYLQSLGPSYRTKKLEDINIGLAKFGIKLRSPYQDVFQHEMMRYQDRLHLRINIPGSFQANLSSGESIPGLPILGLVTELFSLAFSKKYFKEKKTNKYSFSFDLKFPELAKLNRNLLSKYEDKLWEARVYSLSSDKTERTKKNLKMLPNVEKQVILRNKLGLLRIRNIIESLIISQNLKKFRSL